MYPVHKARLARWQVNVLCTSGLLLWASGAAWLALHYFAQVEGPFGPQSNPLEPWMLRCHGAAMLVMLVGAGSLLVVHVWHGWKHRRQRWIGLALLGVLTLLTITGYLLYYPPGDDAHATVSAIHWVIGLGALPLFLWHYLKGRRARRRRGHAA
jgi:hypothetical protein